jgi:hypothetical protein
MHGQEKRSQLQGGDQATHHANRIAPVKKAAADR